MDNYTLEKLQHIPMPAMRLGLLLRIVTGNENVYISKFDLEAQGPAEKLQIVADADSEARIKERGCTS